MNENITNSKNRYSWLTNIGFLVFHALFFIPWSYYLSLTNPLYALAHSGVGVLVFVTYNRFVFPDHFWLKFLGTMMTFPLGYWLSGYVIETFYSYSNVTHFTTEHSLFVAVMFVYFGLYSDNVKDILTPARK